MRAFAYFVMMLASAAFAAFGGYGALRGAAAGHVEAAFFGTVGLVLGIAMLFASCDRAIKGR